MPVVRVSLHIPRITADFVPINFLVDTGATDTYLHPQDAKTEIGIDPARLADPRQWLTKRATNGLGGRVACYVEPAVYLFFHDDGQTRQITHEIHIVPPTVSNAVLPSLLGLDILRHFKVSMDYAGQRLILE